MTEFNHAKRSGRRKRPKERKRKRSLGIDGNPERLLLHRELEWLKNPTRKRWRKLREAQAWHARRNV